jgi:hypothetical protein
MVDEKKLRQMQQWLDSTDETPPFRMAQFWHSDWTHGHNYFAAVDESLESVAEGLAYAIHDCNEDKHQGHGRHHSAESENLAYYDAIGQVLNSEDIKAYQELRRNMRHYILWGGHAPEVVFTPSQTGSDAWDAIVKHPETGEVTIYPTIQGLGMPGPEEIGARPNRSGPGFITRK